MNENKYRKQKKFFLILSYIKKKKFNPNLNYVFKK